VQITRQRIRQSILHSFTETCPACGGTGLVQSKTTTINQLDRWIRRFKAEARESRVELRVNPDVALTLTEGFWSKLRALMLKHFIWIKIVSDPAVAIGEFKMYSVSQNKDVTEQYN
jgi:ribonuclease G